MNELATIEQPRQIAPLRAGGGMAAIVPQDAEQAYRMAQLIVKSGLAPRDMQTPEKVVTAIFHGLEVGLKPMQAIQSIAVVNGRPAIWGDAALGLAMGSGLVEDLLEEFAGAGDNLTAICTIKRRDRATPTVRRFGVEDAKKAGLWGKAGPWSQYSKRMLQMRARSWALRDGFADVLKGLHVVEEARDFASPIQHTGVDTAAKIETALIGAPAGDTADAPPQSQPGSPSAAEATATSAQEAQPGDAGGDPGHEAPTQGGDGAQGELIPAAHSFDGEAAYQASHGALLNLKTKAAVKTFMATDNGVNDIRQHDAELYETLRQAANARLKELTQ